MAGTPIPCTGVELTNCGVYSCAHEGATTDMRIADLKPGWDVVGNDDHRIGTIREVGQHYVKVSGGRFSADIYVPASAIAMVESETVHLNLANPEIEAMGWHQPPRSPDELQTTREPDAEREI